MPDFTSLGVPARFRHAARGAHYEVVATAELHVPRPFENPVDMEVWRLVQCPNDRSHIIMPLQARHSILDKGEVTLQVNDHHIESGDLLIVYRAEVDNSLWARYHLEFIDGRFIPVNLKAAAMMPAQWHLMGAAR
jgi:hypothetical protein